MSYHEKTWEEERKRINKRLCDLNEQEKKLYIEAYSSAMEFKQDFGITEIPQRGIFLDSLDDFD